MTLALAVSSAACASSGAVPRPFPGATVANARLRSEAQSYGATPSHPTHLAQPVAPGAPQRTWRHFGGEAIVQFAMGFRGVPYRLGGADPAGFDCSGLVQYVFAQYGVFVPRVVEQQYEAGNKVKPSDIKPGDLIFFNTKKRGDGVSHVAIAIDETTFVHAPNSTGVVRIETLGSSYWGSRYVGARRIKPASPAS